MDDAVKIRWVPELTNVKKTLKKGGLMAANTEE
jgi:hypothetical protein